MLKNLLSVMLLFSLLAACDSSPEKVYTPPILTGTAYVLAAADHIAVVDLQTQRLSRIKIDRLTADIEADPVALYLLSEEGALGIMPYDQKESKITWHKIIDKGVSLATGKNGELFALGEREFAVVSTDGKVISKTLVPANQSSILYEEVTDQTWLLSRKAARATQVNIPKKNGAKVIEQLGNSIHHGFAYPGRNELWIAEGNEYMNGEPYGVGFKKNGPVMPGGINVLDITTGKQVDFIIVGGNVNDLVLSPDGSKVYAAVSRMPEYIEASLSVVGSESRRVHAELRLCLSCHENVGVELQSGQAEVRALAIRWSESLLTDKASMQKEK